MKTNFSHFLPQPDGGIRQLSILKVTGLSEEEPEVVPIWEVRNQHYWTWDYAQVNIASEEKFKLLITAERGDNDGNH